MRRAPSRPDSSRLYLASLLCMVSLACSKGGDTSGNAESDSAPKTSLVSVETALVTQQTLSPTIRVLGTVTPSPSGYAELSAPAATRVAHVYVATGDPVKQGQPLIAFDESTLRADAQSAAVALETAQAAYDRANRLVALGIVPRKNVEQAAADLAQAKATAVTAQHTNALSTLRSPIAGVVTEINAIQGASVDPPTILVAVTDPAKLNLTLALSPADAATIRSGAAVVLRTNDTPNAPIIGRGIVSGISVTLDSATHIVPARVVVQRTTRPLRVGEAIATDITTAIIAHALTIPPAALVPANDSMTVFVIDRGIARRQVVTVGARADTAVQIVSGLHAGETVVTTGAFGLEDGSKVTVSTPTPAHR